MIPKYKIKPLSEFSEEKLKRYVLFVCKGTGIKKMWIILLAILMAGPGAVLIAHIVFGMFFFIPHLDLLGLFIGLCGIIPAIVLMPKLKRANRDALKRIIAYEKETGKKVIPEYLRPRIEKLR